MSALNLKSLSNDQLLQSVETLVKKERELVESLIWHLQEIQERKLFLELGYASLFECLVRHFKFSEAVAYARISALRMMASVPEAAEALKQGEVTVTTLSLAQSFLRQQERQSKEEITQEDKLKVLELVKNSTTQEVKAKLAEMGPVQSLPLDRVVYLDAERVQLQVSVEKSLLQKIDRIKSLISHQNIDPTYGDILNQALDALIEKQEKARGLQPKKSAVARKSSRQESLAPEKKQNSDLTQGNSVKSSIRGNSLVARRPASRYIPREVRRQVLVRSQGRCEHVQADGFRCGSRFQPQFDHKRPFSRGGTAELGNIQLLCRSHNAAKGSRSPVGMT